ncbi:hypothetical protein D3C80_1335110 [compost metagenome]
MHADQGARQAYADGPERQQPDPGGGPGQPDQPEELGQAHGGYAVAGGEGVVHLRLPVVAEPGGQRQQLGCGVDLFTAKRTAAGIELADGGDKLLALQPEQIGPWLLGQLLDEALDEPVARERGKEGAREGQQGGVAERQLVSGQQQEGGDGDGKAGQVHHAGEGIGPPEPVRLQGTRHEGLPWQADEQQQRQQQYGVETKHLAAWQRRGMSRHERARNRCA